MINGQDFTDKKVKVGFEINLDSHHINHANSKLTITSNYPEFEIEVPYINKIIKELSVIYARLMNQYKFKYQTVISARFDKQDEHNRVLDGTELFINLNINHTLTQTDIDNIDVKSSLEHQIQQHEVKDSGWRFDKINSMTVYLYQTGIMKGSNYIKSHLRSNAILNIEKSDECRFIWSILASHHSCKIKDLNRVSNYKQYSKELNIQGFDFNNGFKCSDVHKFHELNNLSIIMFELNFYQDQNKLRHNIIPIENSKSKSDRVLI